MTAFLGIICGLKSEAASLKRLRAHPHIRVAVSGASPLLARDVGWAFVEDGACGLLSFGISGGLSPRLTAGDLIAGIDVIWPDGRASCAAEWCDTLAAQALTWDRSVHFGPIYGSDIIVESTEEKRRLAGETKALTVDMESHAVAGVAMAAGLPFGVLRAVADGYDQVIPKSAAKGVASDGSVRTLPVLGAALRRPRDFPELIRVGRDSATAHKSLRRGAGHFIPALLRIMDLD